MDWELIQKRISEAKQLDEAGIPAMPVQMNECYDHRVKIPTLDYPLPVAVARPVNKTEIRQNPKADAALVKEWNALRKAKVWDESKVREWSDVAREARITGVKAHVGRIFEICVEKNSELAPDNPARKFKGRVVFQGNQVLDESLDVALFQELAQPCYDGGQQSVRCLWLTCRT